MRKLLLNISVIALSTCIAAHAFAQEKTVNAPIFINPYSPTVPTYESNVPNMVRSTGTSRYSQATRTYTKPNRISGPQYDEVPTNLFAPGYGRIRSEQDFYDNDTGQHYGQYEYFKLLASRGETAKLQEVVKKVQEGGVFDPAKYKAVMSGTIGTSGSSSQPKTRTVVKSAPSKKKVTKNLTEGDLPQKLHNGYDDEPAPQPTYQKNQPIFLR